MMSPALYCLLVLGSLACLATAAPILGLEDEELEDTAIVESTVREVRAIKDDDLDQAPANYHKVYDSGDKGDIGYSRQKADKGKTGYQKFDSFHKKGGDSYGYEKHDSYGLKNKGSAGGHSGKAAYTQKKGDGKKANYQAADDDGQYEVIEESDGDEESSDDGAKESEGEEGDGSYDGEGVSEAEAGIADSGNNEEDAANYENPAGYTYGSGHDYDFK